MRKFLLTLVVGLGFASSMMAQSPDKNSMGFFSIPGYPYCHMQSTSETYAIVTDRIVPLTSTNSYIGSALNMGVTYLERVSAPDGADFVISVDNVYENRSSVDVVDPDKKRPAPRNQTKQSAVLLEIGRFKIYDTPKSTSTTPAPQGPRKFLAKQTIEMGFTVQVINQANGGEGEVVFTDTINVLKDIESDRFPNPDAAKEDLKNRTKDFTLKSVMKEYQPFLAKVVGASPISVNFKIYSVRTKKKCTIDYSDINNAYTSFVEAYEFIKKRHGQIEKFKAMAAPSVTVWEENLKQANLTDNTAKVNKEIAAALYYNMAVYSALIKDYQASYEYFIKADETDLGFGDALQMSKLAQTWIKTVEAYNKRMGIAK